MRQTRLRAGFVLCSVGERDGAAVRFSPLSDGQIVNIGNAVGQSATLQPGTTTFYFSSEQEAIQLQQAAPRGGHGLANESKKDRLISEWLAGPES